MLKHDQCIKLLATTGVALRLHTKAPFQSLRLKMANITSKYDRHFELRNCKKEWSQRKCTKVWFKCMFADAFAAKRNPEISQRPNHPF